MDWPSTLCYTDFKEAGFWRADARHRVVHPNCDYTLLPSYTRLLHHMLKKLTEPEAMKFIAQVEGPFKQLPHLPDGITKFLADIAPWLALISGIFSVLAILTLGPILLGATAVLGTLSMMGGSYYAGMNPIWTLVSLIGALASAVLMLSAFGPLKRKELTGWVYMFWSNILGIAVNVVGIAFAASSIVGAIIGALIGLYILFEVKKWFGPVGKVAAKVKEVTE